MLSDLEIYSGRAALSIAMPPLFFQSSSALILISGKNSLWIMCIDIVAMGYPQNCPQFMGAIHRISRRMESMLTEMSSQLLRGPHRMNTAFCLCRTATQAALCALKPKIWLYTASVHIVASSGRHDIVAMTAASSANGI
jgi:hypothetical protein